jgi:hypothetical protein
MDVATLADLLPETAEHHDHFEKIAPHHDWWDRYAPTSAHASRGALRRRHPRPPGATWRKSEVSFPDDFARLAAALRGATDQWSASGASSLSPRPCPASH